jgi:hypothetical protein
MKTIWIFNHYAAIPGHAGGTRHYYLSKRLREYGWQACVIAAGMEHSTGCELMDGNEWRKLEIYDQIPFIWLRVPSYSDNGPRRILNMLCYSLEALIPLFTKGLPRPDVIVGSQVHPFAALSGALLAERFKVTFVFEVRDL